MSSASPLDLWDRSMMFLPDNLDAIAVSSGALVRPRRVAEASQMLRAFLLYAGSGSLRSAAALARGSGLLDITAEGLFYRLKQSEAFLEHVLAHLVSGVASAPVGYRLLIVDATVVSGPASKGTDFRIHVAYDPVRGVPCSVQAAWPQVGESLALHGLGAGDFVVADRGYGTARNVDCALQAGADLLVRIHRAQLRLCCEDGTKVNWSELERIVPKHGATSIDLLMPVPPDSKTQWDIKSAKTMHKVRLIGAHNGKGEVVWLLTNVNSSRLDDAKACELYRVRWQVELYFKRLKSIGGLDEQPSRDGPTARAGLLAKLILLVLTSLIQDQEQAFSPYGYPVRQAPKPMERIPMRLQATAGRTPSKKALSAQAVPSRASA
jgi:hypothetical protein